MTHTHQSPPDTAVASQDAATPAPLFRTVFALCAAGLLVVGQLYIVLPLFGLFAQSWSTTPAAAGLTTTVFGFCYATGFLLSGPLSDRFGRRRLITIGLTFTALATAAVALAPNLAIGCGLRAVQGLCAATFAPAAFAYIGEHIAPARRATAMTWFTSSFLAAGVLGQVYAQSVANAAGWQGVFLIGAVMLAGAGVALRTVLRPDATSTNTGSTADAYRAMGRLLSRPAVVWLLLATMTLLGGFVALYTGLQLAGPVGITEEPDTLLALRASALPAMVLVPLLSARLGRLPAAARGGGALLAAGIISAVTAIVASIGIGVITLGALLFVFVFAIAVAAPALVEAIGSLSRQARGTAVALYTFVLFVGASLGPQLAAVLGRSFSAIALGAAVLLALGAGMALLGHKLRPHKS